jgi:hypothetical protein
LASILNGLGPSCKADLIIDCAAITDSLAITDSFC